MTLNAQVSIRPSTNITRFDGRHEYIMKDFFRLLVLL